MSEDTAAKPERTAMDANEIPRRIRRDRMTPAELAITAAMEAVESLPPDVRLTDAVNLLSNARDKVADYVDGIDATPEPDTHGPAVEKAMERFHKRLAEVRRRKPLGGDTKPREPGCQCHQEEGDSPCPVHGDEGADAVAAQRAEGALRAGWRELPETHDKKPQYTCRRDDKDPAAGVVYWHSGDYTGEAPGWYAWTSGEPNTPDLGTAMDRAERLCPPDVRAEQLHSESLAAPTAESAKPCPTRDCILTANHDGDHNIPNDRAWMAAEIRSLRAEFASLRSARPASEAAALPATALVGSAAGLLADARAEIDALTALLEDKRVERWWATYNAALPEMMRRCERYPGGDQLAREGAAQYATAAHGPLAASTPTPGKDTP